MNPSGATHRSAIIHNRYTHTHTHTKSDPSVSYKRTHDNDVSACRVGLGSVGLTCVSGGQCLYPEASGTAHVHVFLRASFACSVSVSHYHRLLHLALLSSFVTIIYLRFISFHHRYRHVLYPYLLSSSSPSFISSQSPFVTIICLMSIRFIIVTVG